MNTARPVWLAAAAVAIAIAPAQGQRLSEAKIGISRPSADSTALPLDTIRPPRTHPAARRLGSGLGTGVALGFAALYADVCFVSPCSSWGFVQGGIAGYWIGTVIGTSWVDAKRCSFPKRFAHAFVGALPGTAVSVGVAKMSYLARDMEAFAATTVVALAPIATSTLVLRTCD